MVLPMYPIPQKCKLPWNLGSSCVSQSHPFTPPPFFPQPGERLWRRWLSRTKLSHPLSMAVSFLNAPSSSPSFLADHPRTSGQHHVYQHPYKAILVQNHTYTIHVSVTIPKFQGSLSITPRECTTTRDLCDYPLNVPRAGGDRGWECSKDVLQLIESPCIFSTLPSISLTQSVRGSVLQACGSTRVTPGQRNPAQDIPMKLFIASELLVTDKI